MEQGILNNTAALFLVFVHTCLKKTLPSLWLPTYFSNLIQINIFLPIVSLENINNNINQSKATDFLLFKATCFGVDADSNEATKHSR